MKKLTLLIFIFTIVGFTNILITIFNIGKQLNKITDINTQLRSDIVKIQSDIMNIKGDYTNLNVDVLRLGHKDTIEKAYKLLNDSRYDECYNTLTDVIHDTVVINSSCNTRNNTDYEIKINTSKRTIEVLNLNKE